MQHDCTTIWSCTFHRAADFLAHCVTAHQARVLVPGPFHVFACFKFQPHLPFVAVDCSGLVNRKTTKFAIKPDMLIN